MDQEQHTEQERYSPDEHAEHAAAGQAAAANEIADQIAAVWGGMLTQMTAQGATRADLLKISAHVAQSVMTLTATAMWPDDSQPYPGGEEADGIVYAAVLRDLEEYLS